jgi:type II secretory pathway pseudopilin PulG
MSSVLRRSHGFTYVEMLVVTTLIGLCFVPLLHMFVRSLHEVQSYSQLGTAMQLGRNEMETVKNLRLSAQQIAEAGVKWTPPLEEAPAEVNHGTWRVKRMPIDHTDPLEIWVEVYDAAELGKPVFQLVTLIEDY